MTLNERIIITLLHVLEVALTVGVAVVLEKVLGLPIPGELVGLVLAGLAKFSRTKDGTDWVNGR